MRLRSSCCTKVTASKQKIAGFGEVSKRLDPRGKMGKTLPQTGTSREGGPSHRDEASIHSWEEAGRKSGRGLCKGNGDRVLAARMSLCPGVEQLC